MGGDSGLLGIEFRLRSGKLTGGRRLSFRGIELLLSLVELFLAGGQLGLAGRQLGFSSNDLRPSVDDLLPVGVQLCLRGEWVVGRLHTVHRGDIGEKLRHSRLLRVGKGLSRSGLQHQASAAATRLGELCAQFILHLGGRCAGDADRWGWRSREQCVSHPREGDDHHPRDDNGPVTSCGESSEAIEETGHVETSVLPVVSAVGVGAGAGAGAGAVRCGVVVVVDSDRGQIPGSDGVGEPSKENIPVRPRDSIGAASGLCEPALRDDGDPVHQRTDKNLGIEGVRPRVAAHNLEQKALGGARESLTGERSPARIVPVRHTEDLRQ